MTPVQQNTESISATQSNQILDQIPLGEYIFNRIHQANPKLKTIFGIPGDFNVHLLEHVYADSILSKDIKFINTCNELNGAYTVDAYSRVIGGLSCLITTFGVGELSAINGISGAYTEFAPVLHIVGTTSLESRELAKSKVRNIHHLIPNADLLKSSDHDVYKKMASYISCCQESLDLDMELNIKKIDKVLKTIINERRPGYLFIPYDIPDLMISSQELISNPFSSTSIHANSSKSIEMIENITESILEKLYKSDNPAILSDCLTSRFGYQNELTNFIGLLPEDKIKVFTTNLGRNIDETKKNYVGVYGGNGSSNKTVKEELESSSFLLTLGQFDVEFNTGAYSQKLNNIKDKIIINPDFIKINESIIPVKQLDGERLFNMGDLLTSLSEKFDCNKLQVKSKSIYQYQPPQFYKPSKLDANSVSQDRLVDHFNKILQEDDLVLVETMSFCFAFPDLKFAKNVQVLASNFYGSIGYTIPATFGATVAVNDLGSKRRIILIQGDGAAQMTAQELSSYVRYQDVLPNMPQIYLINNDGYAIERKVKGPFRSYNDINGLWKWKDLLGTFGGVEGKMYQSYLIKNLQEFDDFFANQSKVDQSKLQFYEVIADKYDVPVKVYQMSNSKFE